MKNNGPKCLSCDKTSGLMRRDEWPFNWWFCTEHFDEYERNLWKVKQLGRRTQLGQPQAESQNPE